MALLIDASNPQNLTITFRLPADDPPAPVSVVGSFNDWTPGAHEFILTDNGEQEITATVPYGQTVHFRYLAAGGRWFDDPEADEATPTGSVLHPRSAPETSLEASQADQVRRPKAGKTAPKKARTRIR